MIEGEVITVVSAQLTDQYIENLHCPHEKKHVEYFDSTMRGLYVDVLHTGKKVYRFRFRFGGKSKVITLGDVGIINLAEARDCARNIKRKIRIGVDPKQIKTDLFVITVADFFSEHYLPYVKSYKRSWSTDECIIRNHILPAFGAVQMHLLSESSIAALIKTMRTNGYAAGTCNRLIVLLSYAYTLALRWGVYGVTENPAKFVNSIKHDNKIEHFLTTEQAATLKKVVSSSANSLLSYIVVFLILTGARKREVLDAQWIDIDFENRIWKVTRTKSSRDRHIPLSEKAILILETLKVERRNEYVFANPETGKPFVNIYYSWNTARIKAGLPHLRIHDLRHSFASFLVNAGRSLYEVQQLLGHSDIRTTARYAHLSKKRLFEAVESIIV